MVRIYKHPIQSSAISTLDDFLCNNIYFILVHFTLFALSSMFAQELDITRSFTMNLGILCMLLIVLVTIFISEGIFYDIGDTDILFTIFIEEYDVCIRIFRNFALHKRWVLKNWRSTQVLHITEVANIACDYLDLTDCISREFNEAKAIIEGVRNETLSCYVEVIAYLSESVKSNYILYTGLSLIDSSFVMFKKPFTYSKSATIRKFSLVVVTVVYSIFLLIRV